MPCAIFAVSAPSLSIITSEGNERALCQILMDLMFSQSQVHNNQSCLFSKEDGNQGRRLKTAKRFQKARASSIFISWPVFSCQADIYLNHSLDEALCFLRNVSKACRIAKRPRRNSYCSFVKSSVLLRSGGKKLTGLRLKNKHLGTRLQLQL